MNYLMENMPLNIWGIICILGGTFCVWLTFYVQTLFKKLLALSLVFWGYGTALVMFLDYYQVTILNADIVSTIVNGVFAVWFLIMAFYNEKRKSKEG